MATLGTASPSLTQLAGQSAGGGTPAITGGLSGLASQQAAQANSALSYAPPGMYFNPYTQTPFFFGGGDQNAWIAAQTPLHSLAGPGPQADFNQAVMNWAAGLGPPIVGAGGIGGISAAASPGLAGAPGTGAGAASTGGGPGTTDGSPAPTAPDQSGFESGFASVGAPGSVAGFGPSSAGPASPGGPLGGGFSSTGLGGALAGGQGYGLGPASGALGSPAGPGSSAAASGFSGGFGFGPGLGANAGTSVGDASGAASW